MNPATKSLNLLEMDVVEHNAENLANIYCFLGLKRTSKCIEIPRVLPLISSLLERSVHRNELLFEPAEFQDNITIFHGLRAPALSIRQYVDRIYKYAGCSPSCFVVALVYVDRFIRCTKVRLLSLNVHRLLITSVMLAAKFMDDKVMNNAYYARVGGVRTAELNRLEMKFLYTIDFKLQVSVETFESYCIKLEKEAEEAVQIERRMKSCGMNKNWTNKEDSTCASAIAR